MAVENAGRLVGEGGDVLEQGGNIFSSHLPSGIDLHEVTSVDDSHDHQHPDGGDAIGVYQAALDHGISHSLAKMMTFEGLEAFDKLNGRIAVNKDEIALIALKFTKESQVKALSVLSPAAAEIALLFELPTQLEALKLLGKANVDPAIGFRSDIQVAALRIVGVTGVDIAKQVDSQMQVDALREMKRLGINFNRIDFLRNEKDLRVLRSLEEDSFPVQAINAGVPIDRAEEFTLDVQVEAVRERVSLDTAVQLWNEWQLEALQRGAKREVALQATELHIAAVKAGMAHNCAFKVLNQHQIDAYLLSIPCERALEFNNTFQVKVLRETNSNIECALVFHRDFPQKALSEGVPPTIAMHVGNPYALAAARDHSAGEEVANINSQCQLDAIRFAGMSTVQASATSCTEFMAAMLWKQRVDWFLAKFIPFYDSHLRQLHTVGTNIITGVLVIVGTGVVSYGIVRGAYKVARIGVFGLLYGAHAVGSALLAAGRLGRRLALPLLARARRLSSYISSYLSIWRAERKARIVTKTAQRKAVQALQAAAAAEAAATKAGDATSTAGRAAQAAADAATHAHQLRCAATEAARKPEPWLQPMVSDMQPASSPASSPAHAPDVTLRPDKAEPSGDDRQFQVPLSPVAFRPMHPAASQSPLAGAVATSSGSPTFSSLPHNLPPPPIVGRNPVFVSSPPARPTLDVINADHLDV